MENFTFTKTPIAVFNEKTVNGNVVRVGTDEKRKAGNVVTVFDGKTETHYIMFHKGLEKILLAVCMLLADLLNGNAQGNVYKRYMVSLVKHIWLVHHKNGKKRKSKLAGIISLSTCCLNNPFCLARMRDKTSICAHCFAATQQSIQYGLTEHNIINGLILQNIGIPEWAWQAAYGKVLVNQKEFRIESFGDTANMIQACNYLTFCKAFPHMNIAAWTKNVNIWLHAMDIMGKPANLSFVTSSYKVNKKDIYTDKRIDHSFTVYDKKTIAEKHIDINCGGRSCMGCIEKHVGCYFPDTERDIREELK